MPRILLVILSAALVLYHIGCAANADMFRNIKNARDIEMMRQSFNQKYIVGVRGNVYNLPIPIEFADDYPKYNGPSSDIVRDRH